MAAGHGTRMRSELPKVLHPVCGRPMLLWVTEAARAAGAEQVVCVTRPAEGVAAALPPHVKAAEQREGEGTGAAVLAAREHLEPDGDVLVLSGDHPLVSAELIADLAATHRESGATATLLTTEQLDPAGYGRVVRAGDGSVERIVETKHPETVPAEELAIREINIGAYAFHTGDLFEAVEAVDETRGERLLTDVFPLLRERGLSIAAHRTDDTLSALGVNTRADLMEAERHARARLVRDHALNGVSFAAPETVVIDAGVEIGPDSYVEQGVTLRGDTRVGGRCTLGPHTTIESATLGEGVRAAHSYLVECEVADAATIGPFAYLRPGARIGEGAKVGTYVEIKNSEIGARTKVPHLSYLGDADVGEDTNIGAGNITANYDGREKHRTRIGRGVKTSVDTSFVAPVSVGDEAYTGAGSVITEDVPDRALGIARARQRNVERYADRKDEQARA